MSKNLQFSLLLKLQGGNTVSSELRRTAGNVRDAFTSWHPPLQSSRAALTALLSPCTQVQRLTGAVRAGFESWRSPISQIGGPLNDLPKPVDRLRQRTDAARHSFTQLGGSIRQAWRDMNGFSSASKMMAAAGGLMGAQRAASGVMDYEKSLLVVKANIMSGANSAAELNAQLAEVQKTARDLSKMTIFSDKDMIDIEGQLLKSGVRREDIGGKSGAAFATAALAQLGGIAPETAAAQIGSLGNAFSFKSNKQYSGLADHIVRVDDASAMKSSDILYNMQLVSASAAQLKIDPKRIVSALGYLDPLGNMAGTSMNRFIEGLAGTTKPKKKALQKSGLNFWNKNSDGTETLKDFGEVIEMVRKRFRAMKSDREKIELGHKLFGEEGGRAAAFFAAKDDSFYEFEEKVKKSATATDKLNVAMEGLGAQLSRLKNSAFAEFAQFSTPYAARLSVGVKQVASNIEEKGVGHLVAGAATMGSLYLLSRMNKARKARAAEAMKDAATKTDAMAVKKVFVTNWPKNMLSPGESLKQKRDGLQTPENNKPEGKKTEGKWGKAANAIGAAGAAYSGWQMGYEMIGPMVNEVLNATSSAIAGRESTLGSLIYDLVHEGINASTESSKSMESAAQDMRNAAQSLQQAASRPVQAVMNGREVAESTGQHLSKESRRY
jgi:hypothetical protein